MYNKNVISITLMKLFELLTKEDIKLSRLFKYKKEQILFNEDDECLYVGIVIKGEIKIASFTLSGQEIVYNIIKEGQMFGNNLIFSDYPHFRGTVIASSDGEIILFNKENLLKILQSNLSFLEAYLSLQAEFSKRLNNTIKLLSLSSAEERLLYYLKQNNPLKIKSISSLSEFLYLSREATSRLVSKMVKEGKINRNGNMLYLPKDIK